MPVLISTGERDGHLNCCLIRTVRKIDDAATRGGGSGHARGANYRGLDEADAWGRVLATLKRDHRQPE